MKAKKDEAKEIFKKQRLAAKEDWKKRKQNFEEINKTKLIPDLVILKLFI